MKRTLGLLTIVSILAAGVTGCDTGFSSANQYLSELPPWPEPAPDLEEPVGSPVEGPEIVDNEVYNCTTTEFSITRTPEEVVTFNPGADVFWPGALIQGRSYQGGTGSFAELPIRERAPLEVSVDLLFADNARTVEAPTLASVTQAVGEIIQSARDSAIEPQSSIDFQRSATHSVDQAAVALGLSARYLGASAKAKLRASSSVRKSTVTAKFVQRAFTVSVAPPQTPGDFFSPDFSSDDLQQQIDLGRVGPDNLPVYLSSVTYGRMMLFSFTAEATHNEIAGTLNVMYRGLLGGGSVSLSARQREILSSSELSVLTIGGDDDHALALIRTGDLSEFFHDDVAITSFVPISYTLRNLGDGSVAKVSETSSYERRECVASTAGDVPRDSLDAELLFDSISNLTTPNSSPDGGPDAIIEDGCRIALGADRFGFADRSFDFRGRGSCDAAEPSLVYLDSPGFRRRYSYSLWVRNDLNNRWLIGRRSGPALVVDSSGRTVFKFGSSALLVDDLRLSDDVWTHLAVTVEFDGQNSELVLYRDGSEVDRALVSGEVAASSSAPILIGNAAGGPGISNPGRNLDFQGDMDTVRVYSRPLESGEVVLLRNEESR